MAFGGCPTPSSRSPARSRRATLVEHLAIERRHAPRPGVSRPWASSVGPDAPAPDGRAVRPMARQGPGGGARGHRRWPRAGGAMHRRAGEPRRLHAGGERARCTSRARWSGTCCCCSRSSCSARSSRSGSACRGSSGLLLGGFLIGPTGLGLLRGDREIDALGPDRPAVPHVPRRPRARPQRVRAAPAGGDHVRAADVRAARWRSGPSGRAGSGSTCPRRSSSARCGRRTPSSCTRSCSASGSPPDPAVATTVGATVITDTLALLVLAVVASGATGEGGLGSNHRASRRARRARRVLLVRA